MSKLNQPKVSIVMPVYNGEKYIETAIKSIINQSYKNIELIIIDGGSNDKTLQIIDKYKKNIHYFITEKDNGMYDAINKGFSVSNGDILSWLNSDDFYFPLAIENVVKTFQTYTEIEWLTGRKVIVNQFDQIIKIGCFRSFYRMFIKKGYYRGDVFGFITQEATFWKRSLFEKTGKLNTELKVAADFELWTRFAQHADLYSLNTLLAAFRLHEDQLSSDQNRYYNECDYAKPIRFKYLLSLFGGFIYIFSMLSKKNKIKINSKGSLLKVNNNFFFE